MWKAAMQGASFQKSLHDMYNVSLKLTSTKNLLWLILRQCGRWKV
jgi:hypothetical protein